MTALFQIIVVVMINLVVQGLLLLGFGVPLPLSWAVALAVVLLWEYSFVRSARRHWPWHRWGWYWSLQQVGAVRQLARSYFDIASDGHGVIRCARCHKVIDRMDGRVPASEV